MAKQRLDSGLTSEEMAQIGHDATLGVPSKLQTPEAKEYRKHADEFVRKAKRKGQIIDQPHECPNLD